MPDFSIFRSFDELSQAKEFESFLHFHKIFCRIEQQVNGKTVIQIRKVDENPIMILLEDSQSGYDLLTLSHEELFSRAQQTDENKQLMLDLLKIRIKAIHAIQRNELEEERLKEEYKPVSLSIAMYWFILLSTLFGGIGVFIAIHVVTQKRKLSNGQRIYLYSLQDRIVMTWALGIFSFFVLCFITYLLFSLSQKIN